ncbi:MAG: RNA polymerase sigma factor [Bacteroidales bacterium]|nr:RNA polymerase sigma factor [Bacteroidales bacterium]
MKKKEGKYLNIHQKLIDECSEGNTRSQFKLYKLYYKSMYNTSLRIMKNPQEAEEIMQDSFLSAFSNINTYKGEVSFGAWLKKIVINKSIDSLRKRKAVFEEVNEDMPDRSSDYETDNADIRKMAAQIKNGIKQLPDGYRVILSLYLFEGFDHNEIAEILNISSSTSRSQYTRAKQKLNELLKTNL